MSMSNVTTLQDLAEFMFVTNVDEKNICFQSPGITSGQELFMFLLNLFERGLRLLHASPQTGVVSINDITEEDMYFMKCCMARAGINMKVTTIDGRILQSLHFVRALVNKSENGTGDRVEDFEYLIDLSTEEHARISFSLTYPSDGLIHTGCGTAPFEVED